MEEEHHYQSATELPLERPLAVQLCVFQTVAFGFGRRAQSGE